MKIIETKFTNVLLIEPKVFSDSRGLFFEAWNRYEFKKHGLNSEFVQDNISYSVKNTIRGLHYQIHEPQGKLVRVIFGEAFDVIVDLRKSSKTFGQWDAIILSDKNNRMLWIPPGFAHGFMAVTEKVYCQYKCTTYYNKELERCILWSDKFLEINWPLQELNKPIISDKDKKGTLFSRADYFS